MDNKTEFQKTESTLAAYFKARDRREELIKSIARKEQQIERVEKNIKEMRIPLPTITANYRGVAVSGGEQMSNTERMLLAQEDRLLKELAELKVRKSKLEQRLRSLENRWAWMDKVLPELLTAEEYMIAEVKYTRFRMSLQQIADHMRKHSPEKGVKYHKSTIAAKRVKIVEKVAGILRSREGC